MNPPGVAPNANLPSLALPVPDALVEAVAERAAALVAAQLSPEREPWIGVPDAAAHIAAPRSRVYALAACSPPRIPHRKDGSRLLFRRSELDAWLDTGGGKRP